MQNNNVGLMNFDISKISDELLFNPPVISFVLINHLIINLKSYFNILLQIITHYLDALDIKIKEVY